MDLTNDEIKLKLVMSKFEHLSKKKEMFEPRSNVYGQIIESKAGEFNLVSDINIEESENDNYHNILLVRIPNQNITFPFHADTFIKWFHKQKTHPHTRDGIAYITKRIEFKERCLNELPAKPKREITLEFTSSLVPTDSFNNLSLEQRAFVDTATLEYCKWIHKDLDFDSSVVKLQNAPTKSWLLRKSSLHSSTMKNSEILVIVCKTDTDIAQFRLLNIFGIGWFICGCKILNIYQEEPDFVCLLDVLAYFSSNEKIDINKRIN